MGDSFVTVITIFIAAVLLFVLPIMAMSERTDDVTKLSVQTYTTEFVDDVRLTGKLTSDNYDKYLQKLISTGNTFDVNIELQILDDNPGEKSTEAEMTKIGENLYYVIYTSQIEEKLGNDDKITLKEGDRIVVTAANTNKTVGQTFKDFVYSLGNEKPVEIDGEAAGIVMINGGDGSYVNAAETLNNDIQKPAGGNNEVQILGPAEPKIEVLNGLKPSADGYYNQDVVIRITQGERRQAEVRDTKYSCTGSQVVTEKKITGTSETFTISAEGETNIYAVTTDVNGNSTPSRLWIKIDKSIPNAPIITILDVLDYNQSWYKKDVGVRISMPAGSKNIKKIVYKLDGAIQKTEESVIANGGVIAFSLDGVTKITAYAYSVSGKKSEEVTEEIRIDRVAPILSKENLQADNTSVSSGFNLTVNVIDSISGLAKIDWFYKKVGDSTYNKETTIYNGETSQANRSKSIINLELETYSAYAEIYDKAGNMTKTNEVQIKAGQLQVATGATIKPDYWTNGSVKVTLPTKTGYRTQYQTGAYVDENLVWNQYNTELTFSANTNVFYRYSDGTNASQATTIRISNIDKEEPKIVELLSKKEASSSTIKAGFSANDSISGIAKVVWSYKKKTDSTYIEKVETVTEINGKLPGKIGLSDWEIELTNLKENVTYCIYATIYDAAGNKKVTNQIEVVTVKVPDPGMAFANPTTWTNGNVEVTLPEENGFTMEYQVTQGSLGRIWYEYTGEPIKVTENGTVYYRLVNGGNIGNYKTKAITNIDKVSPQIVSSLTASNVTTNSFKVDVTVKDSLSGFSNIEWYYKHESESSYNKTVDLVTIQNGNEKGSTSNVKRTLSIPKAYTGKYSVYAIIYDVAGNYIESGKIEITINNLEKIGSVTINPTYWTNESVTVTLPTKNGFVTQYQCDLGKDVNGNFNPVRDGYAFWGEYTNPLVFTENDLIYYRYADGLNAGEYATYTITNIDKVSPTVSQKISCTDKTSRGFTLKIGLKDNASGISKVVWYYKKTGTTTTYSTDVQYVPINSNRSGSLSGSKTVVIDGLKSGKYDIYAVAYDVAGNSVTSSTVQFETAAIPDIGTATISPTTWTKGNVTVTIPTNDTYGIEYQTGSTVNTSGTWTKYDKNITITSNTTVFYRYTDGINGGNYNSVTITNIDKTTPKRIDSPVYSTTNSFDAQFKMSDSQSGIAKIEWSIYLKSEGESKATKYTDTIDPPRTEAYVYRRVFSNLKYGEYVIKAKIYDFVGNYYSITSTGYTKKMPETGTADYSPKGYTNVSVTATLPTKTGMTTQYSLDGTNWTNATKCTVTENGTIYYRYTDGTNYSDYKTLNITNIEKVNPVIVSGIELQSLTGTNFTVKMTVQDTGTGLSHIQWTYKYEGQSSYDSGYVDYKQVHGTEKGDTNQKTVTYTINNIVSGKKYYVYAYVVDVAGNIKTTSEVMIQTDSEVDKEATISISEPKNMSSLPLDVKATVTHSDSLSGVNISKCKWELNQSASSLGTNSSNYSHTFSSNGQQISCSLNKTGTWYLHILTQDGAGNKRETIKEIKVSEKYHTHSAAACGTHSHNDDCYNWEKHWYCTVDNCCSGWGAVTYLYCSHGHGSQFGVDEEKKGSLKCTKQYNCGKSTTTKEGYQITY